MQQETVKSMFGRNSSQSSNGGLIAAFLPVKNLTQASFPHHSLFHGNFNFH